LEVFARIPAGAKEFISELSKPYEGPSQRSIQSLPGAFSARELRRSVRQADH